MATHQYRTLTKRIVDRLAVDDKDAVFWDRELPGFGLYASTRPVPRSTSCRLVAPDAPSARPWDDMGMSHPTRPARKPLASLPASRPEKSTDPGRTEGRPRRWPNLPSGTSASTSRCDAGRQPSAHYRHHARQAHRSGTGGSSRSPRSSASTSWRSTTSCARSPRWRTGRSTCSSRCSTWPKVWELRPSGKNPCRFVRRYKVQAQHERFLTAEELGRLGRALDAAPGRTAGFAARSRRPSGCWC